MNLGRIPILIWFLVPTVVFIGAGVWFFSTNSKMHNPSKEGEVLPAAVSTPVEGVEEFDIVSRQHINAGTPGSGYNSNPPTSGVHWPAPVKNGIYNDPLPDEQLIHNLEHGYIWIAYKRDVSDEVKNKLTEIVNEDDWKIVMAPRPTNDKPVILAAWGRNLKMDEPDFDKIKQFIETYRDRGPERTPE